MRVGAVVAVAVVAIAMACVSRAVDPPLVSVCGDPGMRQREPRVLLEGENRIAAPCTVCRNLAIALNQ